MDRFNSFNIEDYKLLAEFIGIMLGDGHLHKKGEKSYLGDLLSISLNRVDEPEYVEYVKNLIFNLFGIIPAEHPRSDSKSIDLKLYNSDIIDFLISIGLKTGDKVKNQVYVPEWIKKENTWIKCNHIEWISNIKPFVIACLRGLIDTDGSIYVDRFNKIIGIGFKNASLRLVKDFKSMCESLCIRTGKITESPYKSNKSGRIYLAYQVLIRAKSHVKEFLYVIKPMKWEYRKSEVENILNSLGTSVKEALKSKYKRNDSYRKNGASRGS